MNKKKSILFVNGHLNVGGVEKALVDLLRWIDYDVFDVDLLLIEGEGDYRSQLPDQVRVIQNDHSSIEGPFLKVLIENLKALHFNNIFYRSIQTLARVFGSGFLRLLKPLLPIRKHYDVSVAFRPGHYAEIARYAVSADRKFCWWHHGEVVGSDKEKQDLSRLLGGFDKVIVVSSGCIRLLQESLGIPEDYIVVIPNIIDADGISKSAGNEDPYGSDKRFRIVTLSRLSEEKHIVDVVEAASLLVGKLDFVWYIVGDGPERDSISRRIRELHLDDRIVLAGNLVNPYPFLKYSDLFVHPSHVESLCIAVLEAMALEKPCLVVRSLGPESYIQDRHNGILIDKGPEAIAQGVLEIKSMDDDAIDSIRKQGRQLLSKAFSPAYVMSKLNQLVDG